MTADLVKIWRQAYEIVPEQLARVSSVKQVATAFNTNIDAVTKISGAELSKLAQLTGLTSINDNSGVNIVNTPQDAVRGMVKCFVGGIAEEWLCENKNVDDWLQKNLRRGHLQMGGQAGIIANVLSVLGVQRIYTHAASLPQMQAKLFLNTDNLFAFDEKNNIGKAHNINRKNDEPLIHRIIEFDAGDFLFFNNQKYVCPKSNRFIATYDPANMSLKIDEGFVKHINSCGFDFMFLSGFHNLTAKHGGVQKINDIVPLVQHWKSTNPAGIIHLELASTQDKTIRREIIDKIAPVVDSVGLNEREALDTLEIIAPDIFASVNTKNPDAATLLGILPILRQKLQTPRIQLHFYGTYLTLQNKDFILSPEQNKRGMMLAATVATAKAKSGNIDKENLLQAHGGNIGSAAIKNMEILAIALQKPDFAAAGIAEYQGFDLTAVPTVLVDKPRTLVGMGDTISSVSLIGAV